MKILHIVPSYKPAYSYGGTIESIARLCEALVNAGQVVTVFTTTANGDEELDVQANREYLVDGVKVIYFERVFKDPFYISTALWKALSLDAENYDVVHIHSWWNILVMRAAHICKKKKIKFIISPHGMMSDYILQNSKKFLKWGSFYAFGRSLLKASLFHATSHAEYEECKKLVPLWSGFMIPNIVWLPPLHISKTPNKIFTIIFLSRIHPKKGIELLMEAISGMNIELVLKIAGSGDDNYLQQLKLKATNLNISGMVEWLGWQDREQKFAALMQADLFVLTSYNENFGNVVVESLHAGTPVLISDKTGLSDFVTGNKLGWICRPTVKDIAVQLRDAINNKPMREEISKRAALIIRGYFSEERLVPEYLRQYQSVSFPPYS